jgi:hypothetical protein
MVFSWHAVMGQPGNPPNDCGRNGLPGALSQFSSCDFYQYQIFTLLKSFFLKPFAFSWLFRSPYACTRVHVCGTSELALVVTNFPPRCQCSTRLSFPGLRISVHHLGDALFLCPYSRHFATALHSCADQQPCMRNTRRKGFPPCALY